MKRNARFAGLLIDINIETLNKPGRECQRRQARRIFLRNPRILLNISLICLPCIFIFSLIPLTPESPPERKDGI